MKIGFNAAAVRDMHALLAAVQASSPDDLLWHFLHRCKRELNWRQMRCCEWAEKVLAITGFTRMPCKQRASRCLYTIAEEQKRQTVLQSLLVTLREC